MEWEYRQTKVHIVRPERRALGPIVGKFFLGVVIATGVFLPIFAVVYKVFGD
jgi:hypothetical protein